MIHGKTNGGSVCQVRQPLMVAVTQGFGITPEIQVLVPNFSPSLLAGEAILLLSTEHFPFALLSLCLKSPAQRALLGITESVLVMLFSNFKGS